MPTGIARTRVSARACRHRRRAGRARVAIRLSRQRSHCTPTRSYSSSAATISVGPRHRLERRRAAETARGGRSRRGRDGRACRSSRPTSIEVEVLHPDLGVGAADLRDRAGVRAVGVAVARPLVVDVAHAADEAVQQRPQALVAEPGVEALAPRRRIVELRARDRLAVLDAHARGRDRARAPLQPSHDAVGLARAPATSAETSPPTSLLRARRLERSAAGSTRRSSCGASPRVAPAAARARSPDRRRWRRARASTSQRRKRWTALDDRAAGSAPRCGAAACATRIADVALAQADEHVLVGRVVADREHVAPAGARRAQPRERDALVRGAMADLERLDAPAAARARGGSRATRRRSPRRRTRSPRARCVATSRQCRHTEHDLRSTSAPG